MTAQGHSGDAWSILGAAAQATERIGLMSCVTCPTMRYHPAVVAQKASTMQILSKNRFRLGLGAGEKHGRPNPDSFEAATQFIEPGHIAQAI